MKINYNMSAYTANGRLQRNESKLTESIERLSSGYRINHASDDPAGMAISFKMKAQIRGLDQAERNAADGTSVIETAEGALSEVTAIIQRMRELAVQAGNDTYTYEDKQSMQDEIEALKKEIDRISTDTEFNKMTILDGSKEARTFANCKGVDNIDVSDKVKRGTYEFKVDQPAEPAKAEFTVMGLAGKFPEGTVSINGVDLYVGSDKITIEGVEYPIASKEQGPTNDEVYAALQQTCQQAEVKISYTGDSIWDGGKVVTFESTHTGSNEVVRIEVDNDNIKGFFENPAIATSKFTNNAVEQHGSDVQVTPTPAADNKVGFTTTVATTTNGNMVTFRDYGGFEITLDVSNEAGALPADNVVTLNVTGIGDMEFQVGANQYQVISISIPEVSTKTLRIDTLDVTTVFGADKALASLDAALEKVSSVRSALGAVENRLDYARDNLDETEEDMEAALSRIEDVDMAEEMSNYTQQNVLVQAATSVLAQANDLPQQCLQLLQ